MDEKTEELRDIFVDVTETETVTETQAEQRGSIAVDEGEIEERIGSVVDAMDERYGLETSLSRSELVTVVRSFYAGESDAEIADELGTGADEVGRARIELHLVTEDDREDPVDADALREVEEERRLIGDRFRQEFEHVLGDRALSDRLTEEIKEDGLEDATEGIETDVSF